MKCWNGCGADITDSPAYHRCSSGIPQHLQHSDFAQPERPGARPAPARPAGATRPEASSTGQGASKTEDAVKQPQRPGDGPSEKRIANDPKRRSA